MALLATSPSGRYGARHGKLSWQIASVRLAQVIPLTAPGSLRQRTRRVLGVMLRQRPTHVESMLELDLSRFAVGDLGDLGLVMGPALLRYPRLVTRDRLSDGLAVGPRSGGYGQRPVPAHACS